MASVHRLPLEEWHPRAHGERRSGGQRRREVPVSLDDPYRADDRRFGLGRRWEDWCRPMAAPVDRSATVARH